MAIHPLSNWDTTREILSYLDRASMLHTRLAGKIFHEPDKRTSISSLIAYRIRQAKMPHSEDLTLLLQQDPVRKVPRDKRNSRRAAIRELQKSVSLSNSAQVIRIHSSGWIHLNLKVVCEIFRSAIDFRIEKCNLSGYSSLQSPEALSLKKVDLFKNELTPFLKTKPATLRTLKIEDCINFPTELIQSIFGLDRLERLEIINENSEAYNLEGIEQLHSLRTLRLNGQSIKIDETTTETLATLPLTNLSLRGVRIFLDEDMVYLGTMRRLHTLEIEGEGPGSVAVTDKGMAHLSNLPRLSNLTLHDFLDITDEGIKHLSKLPITALALKNIVALTEKALLHLRGTPLKKLRIFLSPNLKDKTKIIEYLACHHLTSLSVTATLNPPIQVTLKQLQDYKQVQAQQAAKRRRVEQAARSAIPPIHGRVSRAINYSGRSTASLPDEESPSFQEGVLQTFFTSLPPLALEAEFEMRTDF